MRLAGTIGMAILVILTSLSAAPSAGASVPAPARDVQSGLSRTPQAPNCGSGVRPRKVVATYRAKRYQRGGYRTDTLYCGNSNYGYRHLRPHIGQYFGGWGTSTSQ